MKDTMKMSETITALESLFDKLNGIYFEGKLPRPVITVQSTPKAYGHCTTKQIWKSNDSAMYEINLGAEFINRPMEQTAATLCHEMVHLYCLENDIQDTCQKGRYHNKTFKREAEDRDLHIEYDRAIGYSLTSPTDTFIAKLKESGFDMSIKFARVTAMRKPTSDREKPHKYVCPICGQEVRSTSELNLICGVCNVKMERMD
ncbi:MAG: SprT-like domain-containing protein [Clostridia bacterium]|nr:SprT-like domain-containing protein [Clostridia bacterium]